MLLNPSILKYKPSLIAFSILLIGLKNSDINKLNQILQIDKNDDIKIHFKATKLYKCCTEIVSWLINFKSDPNYMIFDSVFSKYENSFEIDPRDYNIINLIENDFLI